MRNSIRYQMPACYRRELKRRPMICVQAYRARPPLQRRMFTATNKSVRLATVRLNCIMSSVSNFRAGHAPIPRGYLTLDSWNRPRFPKIDREPCIMPQFDCRDGRLNRRKTDQPAPACRSVFGHPGQIELPGRFDIIQTAHRHRVGRLFLPLAVRFRLPGNSDHRIDKTIQYLL